MVRRTVLIVLSTLVLAGCGGAQDVASTGPTDGPTDAATATETESATEPAAVEVSDDYETLCESLSGARQTYDDFLLSEVGSEQERDAVELLGQFGQDVVTFSGGEPASLGAAVDSLHQSAAGFISGEEDVPSEDELVDALATVDAWIAECEAAGAPIVEDAGVAAECPAPETLQAQGLACDVDGNLFPVADGYEYEGEEVQAECPAPETLEAEGLACDEYGNTYPADG